MNLKPVSRASLQEMVEISGLILLCISSFLIPYPRSWSLWPLGLFLLAELFIIFLDPVKYIQELLERWYLIVPPILYFILYAIYFMFKNTGWALLEDKLMFALIPLLGISLFSSERFLKNIRYFLISYISGLLLICIYLLCRAIAGSFSFLNGSLSFNSFIAPGISRFTWEQLSVFMHPTYLAISILIALSLLLFYGTELKIGNIIRISVTAFFIFFLFLLTVKASLLICVMLVILFIIKNSSPRNRLLILGVAVPVMLSGIYLFAKSNKRISSKISEIENRVLVDKVALKDLDPRTKSWYTSALIIEDHPVFGVGPASRDTLAVQYQKLDYETEARYRLNSHNQYLETQLALGIPGTLLLIWMILNLSLCEMNESIRKLRTPFLMIILISMIFESILVRQAGIMLFVMFYCILTFPRTRSKLKKK